MEHADGIADPEEGKKTVKHAVGNITLGKSQYSPKEWLDAKAVEDFGIFKFPNGAHGTFSDLTMYKDFEAPDMYILCSSTNCSRETMKQFGRADSCLAINDIPNFFQTLTKVLSFITPVRFRGIYYADYSDRELNWNGKDWGTDAALRKAKRFSLQHEVRAVWQPLVNKEIKPVITGHQHLTQFVEKIDV